ncbi:peptide-methionine (S)-S-oxide reductase [Halorubellus sp. PRR65]|uniref:peptide-methionine (S)-S-oxide reductase n=1 Tax=Halorubellus sp. PRR65 TaxID=3098148 RepID=UPI002B25F80B|nr:peptide-methionine (S)-S-oxide reductase [Halorubellus sp. PRR65]
MSRWTAADVTAYDERAPASEETRTFTAALGCFWGPDATFGALPGVVRTRVGYAGGTESEPTYERIGDHSEVVQVDYDPEETTFPALVDDAVGMHDPTRQPAKRQYHHVLFHETDGERETIEAALDALAVPSVETRVEPLASFTLAEPYHQKFNLRGKRWATDAFDDAGYDRADVRESPAAAKLNAELAGRDVPELGALEGRDHEPAP